MGSPRQKNFSLKPVIAAELDRFVEHMTKRGAQLKHSHVVGAALLLFLKQDEAAQISLIQRARNYDLEKILDTKIEGTELAAEEIGRTFKEAPVGLCHLDKNLRYVQINEFLAAINGLSVEAHIGKTVMEVLPKIAAAGVAKEMRQVLKSGDPIVQGVVTAETPAHPGEHRSYMHDYHAVRSDNGEIIGVACCVVDITGLTRLKEKGQKHKFTKTAGLTNRHG